MHTFAVIAVFVSFILAPCVVSMYVARDPRHDSF
jgi:hypothetical protein